MNFAPAVSGNGVYFLNCCSNANMAYYKFSGVTVGNVFNMSQGQISFYLKSRYSFAQRQANGSGQRHAFDVRDGNGTHLFNFMTQVYSGNLVFTYNAAGGSSYYYVPQGTEETLFGSGVVLQVTMSWDGTNIKLYLNNTLVNTTAYTQATANWTAASLFDFGAYEYLTFGGYDSEDDILNQFTVSAPPPAVTIPPVITITAPSSGAYVSGNVTVTSNATDNVGVASVQFKLDGANLGAALTGAGPTYSTVWNTAGAGDGPHTLLAVASDAAGNSASSSLSVTVNNPLLKLQSDSTEVAGASNGSVVTPSIGPAGFTGAVVVRGSGSVNFTPAVVGNGVYFLNCCSNTNMAYYKFSSATLGSIFNMSQGQVSFYLKSRYSFAQRKANAAGQRYAFDVRDGNGTHLFNFMTQVYSGNLVFTYSAAGASSYYYVPSGTEDTLFGNGVALQVTLAWDGANLKLYLNNTLVNSTAYTPAAANWTAASLFDFGAYEYLTFGGYNSEDDIIDEFVVM